MNAKSPGKDSTWSTYEFQHEGFPVLLRFPEKPDFDALQKKYPKLVVVKHHLEKVRASGLPEADYNDSLADFDQDLVTCFENNSSGITVLVETFGGRRIYYAYVIEDLKMEDVRQRFTEKYPALKLEWTQQDGKDWRLIRRYSAEHQFYKKK